MTPTKRERSAKSYPFGQLELRPVVADFSGGQLKTDAGVILIAQLDQPLQPNSMPSFRLKSGISPSPTGS